jgi:Ca-activated chloride channel family protein
MNIVGVGRSFVYVIDTSSSMDGPRLRQAKSQLKASLRLLQPNQQFAVIFYNEITRKLRLRRQAEQTLYFATEVNRQLAAQEIDSVLSDAGTDHRPALLEALALQPDVVYFLTDGDDPSLSKADLKDIRHAANATTIHVIRFGDGVWNRSSDNWLQQLAAQNQGEYRELSVPAN